MNTLITRLVGLAATQAAPDFCIMPLCRLLRRIQAAMIRTANA